MKVYHYNSIPQYIHEQNYHKNGSFIEITDLCDRPSSDDSWGRGRNVDEACLVAVLGWDLTLRHLTAQRVFGIGDKAAAWGHLWILSTSVNVKCLHYLSTFLFPSFT